MHATGPIAIASIQVASTANSIHRGQSSVRRASPTHGGRWLAQTTYDALMTHHTTENILIGWVAMAVPRGGQEPLPLKVAPIQPSVTAAFHLQSRWDSDCQMWELKNAGACIWISLQRFTLKYIMNTYDGTLYLEPTLVSQTSGHFQLMFVTYFAVNVLKCTDIHVQAYNSIFVIMVILWNGCIFLCIAFTRLFVYLNWVNLLCRSIWPHCPYMVQCNTVYIPSTCSEPDGTQWQHSQHTVLRE